MSNKCLEEFLIKNNKLALAFSGGTDSSYLLAEAIRVGVKVKAYLIRSQFQPASEIYDAINVAKNLNAELEIIDVNILNDKNVCPNTNDRCYYCKHHIFEEIIEAAKKDGFETIIDGTNASDDALDRPGMKAISEMNIVSPLRICGITKDEVRLNSKEMNLFTWDKPSNSCLATRIPTGIELNKIMLNKIEESEKVLTNLGFKDFRVRLFNGAARIQVKSDQLKEIIERRNEIKVLLKPYFNTVLLDLEGR